MKEVNTVEITKVKKPLEERVNAILPVLKLHAACEERNSINFFFKLNHNLIKKS